MDVVAKLVSVNVGQPREITWRDRTVFTGIWKESVAGRRAVGRVNVDGDGQGDRAGHGGEQRAVFVYQLDSYRFWQEQLQRDDFTYGQFGENFTVEGLHDDEVCIGDRYRIGTAVFEVTQPRVTCYRVGIRMDEPRMAALLVAHGRPGFYFRVVEEGDVEADDEVVKLATGPEAMTVAALNAMLYLGDHHDVDRLERALRIPALSPGWQTSMRALLDAARTGAGGAGNPGLTEAVLPPAWAGFRRLQVTAKQAETSDVVVLDLASDDGEPLPTARAGQFITLRFAGGTDGPPLVRSYSLSGSVHDVHYRIAVKIERDGAAGHYVSSRVAVGDRIEVGAPRGSFVLDDGDRPVVLLSGGIGVTPMLAMLHALRDRRSARAVWWVHGARNRAEHAFADEAAALLDDLDDAHRLVCYSRPGPADRAGIDYDLVGRVTPSVLETAGVPLDGEFYLCGPTAFMDQLRDGLGGLGVPIARVHTEIFGAHEAITPGIVGQTTRPPHPPDGVPATGPLVTFVRSGLDVRWGSGARNLLELAEMCDVPVRWSCRTGVCHTCETPLLDGAVEYDPEPLDPPADGTVLLCCARPVADLTVDL